MSKMTMECQMNSKTQMRPARVIAAIPCYNEEQFIGNVIRRASRYVDQVIVVDDGSSDRTAEVEPSSFGTRSIKAPEEHTRPA